MISLYIEKDVILDDLKMNKTLIDALSAFEKLSENISINIIMNHDNDNIDILNNYFHFNKLNDSFEELFNSFEFITKDETYISYNSDNLLKWDKNKGKSIMALQHKHSHDFELELNKIFLTDSSENNLKKLRIFIHI